MWYRNTGEQHPVVPTVRRISNRQTCRGSSAEFRCSPRDFRKFYEV
jgi:hypothetical protein